MAGGQPRVRLRRAVTDEHGWSDETTEAARAKLGRMRLALFGMRDEIARMSDTEYEAFIQRLHRRWIVEAGPALLRLWLETTPGAAVLGQVLPPPEDMFRQLADE